MKHYHTSVKHAIVWRDVIEVHASPNMNIYEKIFLSAANRIITKIMCNLR